MVFKHRVEKSFLMNMQDADYDFYGQYIPEIERIRIQLISRLNNIITAVDSDELIAEHMKSRVKKADSARAKLEKDGLPTTAESALENLSDVIGIRIVTRFVGDIYTLLDAIERDEELNIVGVEDYIASPKESGYRSLHISVEVDAPGIPGRKIIAEIQLRTIAMDCWASLEHQLKYKKQVKRAELIAEELHRCADEMASTDLTLQTIRDLLARDSENVS